MGLVLLFAIVVIRKWIPMRSQSWHATAQRKEFTVARR